MQFKDLPPQKDPKGGSPRTPLPMSRREILQDDTPIVVHHNGTVWKAITGGLVGLLAGMIVAWFTALSERGVSRIDMENYVSTAIEHAPRNGMTRQEVEDYVSRYTPWSLEKGEVKAHIATQDQQIGELRTKIDQATNIIKEQHDVLKR